MSRFLNEKIDTPQYDGLIAAGYPPTDTFHVTIRGETAEATLKRGTILALSQGTAGDNKTVILGTEAKENETLTANCILCDDTVVEAGTDTVALAYRSGHFARNKVIVKDAYTLTKTDEEELRKCGILMSDVMEY